MQGRVPKTWAEFQFLNGASTQKCTGELIHNTANGLVVSCSQGQVFSAAEFRQTI